MTSVVYLCSLQFRNPKHVQGHYVKNTVTAWLREYVASNWLEYSLSYLPSCRVIKY